MKQWITYMSENPGGHWKIFADKGDERKEGYTISDLGSRAVMIINHDPGDCISVNIISASIEDSLRPNSIIGDKQFYIQLVCLKDDWTCISKEYYNAEDAIKIAKMFLGLRKETAKKIWFLKKLGPEGNRIDY